MTFETLRTRFLYKPLDAVLASSVLPAKQRGGYLRDILARRSSRYDRVRSLVALVDTILPGSRKWAVRRLLRPSLLPFATCGIEVIGAGSGSTVFLLEAGGVRMVLKAYRKTLGASADRLLEFAAFYKGKYDTVSTWYRGPYPIVLPAAFVVLHSPLLGQPAVACLQPYLEEEKRDVIGDLQEGLPRLLEEDSRLRDQFHFFARRTLEIRAERGSCVDLLGPGNLLIAREGGIRTLRLIDYGILDLPSLKNSLPDTSARIDEVLSRLESIEASSSIRAGDSTQSVVSD